MHTSQNVACMDFRSALEQATHIFLPFWNQGRQEIQMQQQQMQICACTQAQKPKCTVHGLQMPSSTKAKIQHARTVNLHLNKLQTSFIPFQNQGAQKIKMQELNNKVCLCMHAKEPKPRVHGLQLCTGTSYRQVVYHFGAGADRR